MQEHCALKQKHVAFDTTRKLIAILISKKKKKKNVEVANSSKHIANARTQCSQTKTCCIWYNPQTNCHINFQKKTNKEVEKKNFEHRNSFWFLFSCRRHSLKSFHSYWEGEIPHTTLLFNHKKSQSQKVEARHHSYSSATTFDNTLISQGQCLTTLLVIPFHCPSRKSCVPSFGRTSQTIQSLLQLSALTDSLSPTTHLGSPT